MFSRGNVFLEEQNLFQNDFFLVQMYLKSWTWVIWTYYLVILNTETVFIFVNEYKVQQVKKIFKFVSNTNKLREPELIFIPPLFPIIQKQDKRVLQLFLLVKLSHVNPRQITDLTSMLFKFKFLFNFNDKSEIKWFFPFFSYMKPLLTHSRPTLLETLPVCCNPVARLLTTTEQLTQVIYPP